MFIIQPPLKFINICCHPLQSSMVFYENSGLENLYGIVQYCQVLSLQLNQEVFEYNF